MSTTFSLQAKIAELERLEAYFQKPEMDIQEAIEKHKEALHVAKEILAYLEKAENTLKEIDIQQLKGMGMDEADDNQV